MSTYRCPLCTAPEGASHRDACPQQAASRRVRSDETCWSCRAPMTGSHRDGCALTERVQRPRTVWGRGWM